MVDNQPSRRQLLKTRALIVLSPLIHWLNSGNSSLVKQGSQQTQSAFLEFWEAYRLVSHWHWIHLAFLQDVLNKIEGFFVVVVVVVFNTMPYSEKLRVLSKCPPRWANGRVAFVNLENNVLPKKLVLLKAVCTFRNNAQKTHPAESRIFNSPDS